jgi:L,D-transpeptidase YcbB
MKPMLLLAGFILAIVSCKKHEPLSLAMAAAPECSIDSMAVERFVGVYPLLAEHRVDLHQLYRKQNACIWYKDGRLVEFAHVLYTQISQLEEEGLPAQIPYKTIFDQVLASQGALGTESELLLSALYFYYTCKVYGGLDHDRSIATGWFIPREKTSYVRHLDSLLIQGAQPKAPQFFEQYYHLRKALQRYREIEKNGGWQIIPWNEKDKAYNKGDSSHVIKSVRSRLFVEGYLERDSEMAIFDQELAAGIVNFYERSLRQGEAKINTRLITLLNVPVASRIRTISVNMERCRWIGPGLSSAREYIAVNIPSFRLHYIRQGKTPFISRVVVGKELNPTVVFGGQISYIAFSPYWNVPASITNSEILPALKKDPEYLEKHQMEWNEGRIRQKPGPNNALGLVKFMFPNSNNIYLHDTPARSLFAREERAFSHGCVRVERARELAIEITSADGGWTTERVDQAMQSGAENYYILKKKLPVYIAYFTAWADESGQVAFFDDVYQRDKQLADLLFKSDLKNKPGF